MAVVYAFSGEPPPDAIDGSEELLGDISGHPTYAVEDILGLNKRAPKKRSPRTKFNPNHAGPGPGGGQFISGDGDGGGGNSITSDPGGVGSVPEATAGGGGDQFVGNQVNPAGALYERDKGNVATPEDIINAADYTTPEAVAEIQARIDNGTQTIDTYRNPDGTYEPDRQAFHTAKLLEVFTPEEIARATPPPGVKPTATLLGGRGGSGKSWFTDSPAAPVDKSHAIVLDNDKFKFMLGSHGWDAALYHEEAGDLMEAAERRARELGLNVIIDATMKSERSAAEKVQTYQAAGYRLDGHYMYASPPVAAGRALYRSSHGTERRFVPVKYVLESKTNETTFDNLKSNFDHWSVYDNNGADFKPRLVARGSH